MQWGVCLAGATVGVVMAAGVSAQVAPVDDASRLTLIQQAVDASTAGDHARSLDLATRAAAIAMTPSLRSMIAAEQEQTGQLAAALASAEQCEREATDDATVPSRDAVLARCHVLAAHIGASVGRVIVIVPTPAPADLAVRVAGETLARDRYGTPWVVAPGDVSVEASASGSAAFHRTVHAEAGGSVVVLIELAATRVALPPVPVASTAIRAVPPRPRGPGAGPWIVAGIGVAALGSSTAFYVLRQAALARCRIERDVPDAVACPDDPTRSTIIGWDVALNVALVAGGALVATGAAWLLFAALGHPRTASAVTASVVPLAGGGAVAAVGGAL